eukprot:549151-Hanusia_phi.AAC.1
MKETSRLDSIAQLCSQLKRQAYGNPGSATRTVPDQVYSQPRGYRVAVVARIELKVIDRA